jgi:hypothetical protein
MDDKKYLIPEALLNAVMTYLASRPYQEVSQAIPALQNLVPYVPPEAPHDGP